MYVGNFGYLIFQYFALKNQLEHKNCSVIDIKSIPEILQNEVIAFIHGVLESFDKYRLADLTQEYAQQRF